MRYFLISDNQDTVTGMRLVGIEGIDVHTEQDLERELDNVIKQKDIAVLILTEKIGNMCQKRILDIKLNYKYPVIAIIPDRHGTGRSADSITSYVTDAIGLKL